MNLEGRPGSERSGDGIVTVELRFDSMRQFQAEFSPNLSNDGVFIPHSSPFPPSTVVRFTVTLPDEFRLLEGVGVVLWAREEEAGSGQPAGMALRFASLGPRSQELIDSLVDAFVVDGGSPFELESFGEGDEFIPTDALVGRTAMPERRPLPSLGDLEPEDGTPRLKIRGVVDDLPHPRVVPAGLDDEVTAVRATEAPGRPAAATAPELEFGLPAAVSEPATEALWREGLEVLGEPGDGAGDLAGEASETHPSGPESPGPAWDLTFPSGVESEEVEVTVEPEIAQPPPRPASRPDREVDSALEVVTPSAGSSDEVTAAELVAEVIADEEQRSLQRDGDEGQGASPGESDEAVDTFADSLRTLDQVRNPSQVGVMPEVTILPRDEEEEQEQQPARRVPWGALAAVAVVLVVAVTGYLTREPIAKLLVPDSPGESPVAVNRPAGGPGITIPTPTAVAVASVATPSAPAVEPTPVVEPTPTPTPAAQPVEPTAVPPEPTAAPTPSRPLSGSAGRVEDIRWSSDGGRTVVTIVTDGVLAEDRVRVGTMNDPPRVLVRLVRVDRFRRYELPVGTNELDRIRIGHHPEQSPPSLHLVLDLTRADVRLFSTEVEGAEVKLTLGR